MTVAALCAFSAGGRREAVDTHPESQPSLRIYPLSFRMEKGGTANPDSDERGALCGMSRSSTGLP